jgi:hypothetical protein
MRKYEAIAKGFEEYGRMVSFMIYSEDLKKALLSASGDGFFSRFIQNGEIDCDYDIISTEINCAFNRDGWDYKEIKGIKFTPKNMPWNQKKTISICDFAEVGDVLIYEDCVMKNLVSSKKKNTIWLGFKSGGIDNEDKEAHLLKVVRTWDGREIPEHLKYKEGNE